MVAEAIVVERLEQESLEKISSAAIFLQSQPLLADIALSDINQIIQEEDDKNDNEISARAHIGVIEVDQSMVLQAATITTTTASAIHNGAVLAILTSKCQS